MISSGIHQVPNAHSAKLKPSTKPDVALTTGSVLGRPRILAPASTVIAVAPIRIQYGGPSVAGVIGTVSQRSMIRDTSSRYSTSPMLHIPAATGASRLDCDGQDFTRVAATTARDCVLTTHSSHEPLTPPRTESRCLASSRLAGTP